MFAPKLPPSSSRPSPSLIPKPPTACRRQFILVKITNERKAFSLRQAGALWRKLLNLYYAIVFYRKLEAVYIAVKLASRNSCVFKERFKVC